jgi:hypothetical protein
MKTAYELAMERLNRTSPARKLSEDQKRQLAELDSRYAARIAEREISLQGELEKAAASGDAEKSGQLQEQLIRERKALLAELESKKDQVRQGKT